jgi:glycosyltransferase involved in cell wall biosynthesis
VIGVATVSSNPPTVSVVIPTLNSERYLDECLGALREQDYPADCVEIVLIDAGSTDRTLEIAERHAVDRVLDNPLRTGEAGKAVGIHAARGELVCMVDSDNVVIGDDWLTRMVAPFSEPDVISSEALRWDYRRQDSYVDRYQSLTGINDPMCLWVGNYGRWSELKQRWTDYPHRSERRDGWEKVVLEPHAVPTMGANGYIVRRVAFEVVPVASYLFDIDFVHDLVAAGYTTVARVDVPIRHYFCDGLSQFIRKTQRRTDDFFYFSSSGSRSYPWTRQRLARVAMFGLSTVLVVPLLVDIVQGMRRRPDPAWLFHIPACWVTLVVYGVGTIRGKLAPRRHDRAGWRQ